MFSECFLEYFGEIEARMEANTWFGAMWSVWLLPEAGVDFTELEIVLWKLQHLRISITSSRIIWAFRNSSNSFESSSNFLGKCEQKLWKIYKLLCQEFGATSKSSEPAKASWKTQWFLKVSKMMRESLVYRSKLKYKLS